MLYSSRRYSQRNSKGLAVTMAERTRVVLRFALCCFLLQLSNLVNARNTNSVTAHLGQDIELSCDVNITSENAITSKNVTSRIVSWSINNQMRYSLSELFSGRVSGHNSSGNNLIVKDIMMNDPRDGNAYRCLISTDNGTTFTVNDLFFLYVVATGVPEIVPNVTIDNNTININENNVTFTLSWGEPFNNLDPIVNYTVSCSGDIICPPNFTTTDNTTRSYTITNSTPMTNYTFSVVATNSIGSGKAGVVMITTPPSDIITTTSSVDMTTTTSSVGMTTATSSVDVTTTSSVGMTTTPIVGMTTTTTTSSVSMTTTTTTTSSVGMTTTTTTTTSSVSMTTTSTSSVGMITTSGSPSTTIAANTTTTTSDITQTSSSVDPCTVNPSSASCTAVPVVSDDVTDSNGAVIIAIVVVVIVLILCCFIIMNILFCYCCKRKEQNDQNNEKDKTAHYSIIVLGILTCGTSVILWWLYKEFCGSKEKYKVEGHSAVPLFSTTTKSSKKNSCKDKKVSSKSADAEMTEAASIQGSPTEVTYAETTKAFNEGTHTGPAVHYDYARTGAVKIVGMPDVGGGSAQQPEPSEPIMESYAVTEIIPTKDKKKDKKAKTDTKNQQPLEYTVVDKSKKKGKKDTKPQKPEINYMDPTNLEFAEEPRNHTLSFDVDHTVQYADLAESLKYTNI